jgi:hypothetical protein
MPTLWVNGIVAARDKMPYIVLSRDEEQIAQLSIAQALNLAQDIYKMAARSEADAMIHKFFSAQEYPAGANNALMVEFRDFRAKLDEEDPRTEPKEG